LTSPIEISIAAEQSNHENIEQRLHRVDNLEHKYRLLDHLLTDPDMMQTIIFTATKRQADSLVEKLATLGKSARALHGGMNQRQRTRTLKELRQEQFDILVATDVAARGIDVQTISHVINFDLPRSTEDYVHRIGRTGRAGATGIALSFASPKDMSIVRQIEKFTGQKMNMHQIPGMEPRPEKASPYRDSKPDFARKKPYSKGKPNQYRAAPKRWHP
jgi:superfamily II DNA/RNA helicase